jgi:hypothetical protein
VIAKAYIGEPLEGCGDMIPRENFENQGSNFMQSGALWTIFFTSEKKTYNM